MKPSGDNAYDRAEERKISQIQCSKILKSQPVGQLNDIGDTSLPKGPLEPATPSSEVSQEPHELPFATLEWTTCDLNSHDMCSEVYNFLHQHYADVEQLFKEAFSKEFLRWLLCPPGYYQSWHIGVRFKRKLVGFISGVPEKIRVHDKVVKVARINILCVQKSLRSMGIADVMIKEVTRRVHLENIWQAAYSLPNIRDKPVTSIVCHCQYWLRMLNPQKLVDVGFTSYRDETQMKRLIRVNKLPDATVTCGFREMELRDVPAVTELLRNYLLQFGVATEFDEIDVKHWLLPRKDVVQCYVVECAETHVLTDFCSFYIGSLTIDGDHNLIHQTVECAYSYYNVATQTPLPQLMNDALIVSQQKGIDAFFALDVMQNESFFEKLKFNREEDSQMHYYLYNYRLTSALKPSELGLVF